MSHGSARRRWLLLGCFAVATAPALAFPADQILSTARPQEGTAVVEIPTTSKPGRAAGRAPQARQSFNGASRGNVARFNQAAAGKQGARPASSIRQGASLQKAFQRASNRTSTRGMAVPRKYAPVVKKGALSGSFKAASASRRVTPPVTVSNAFKNRKSGHYGAFARGGLKKGPAAGYLGRKFTAASRPGSGLPIPGDLTHRFNRHAKAPPSGPPPSSPPTPVPPPPKGPLRY